MMYELGELAYAPPDNIDCRYSMPDPEQTQNLHILVVSFSGTYPRGSEGDPHAAFITLSTMHGLHAFEPDCIVLDFRSLDYQWGNAMLRVFQDIGQFMDFGHEAGVPNFPVVVVASGLTADALSSLLSPEASTAGELLFSDIDEAIATGVDLARAWLDA